MKRFGLVVFLFVLVGCYDETDMRQVECRSRGPRWQLVDTTNRQQQPRILHVCARIDSVTPARMYREYRGMP